MPYITHEERVPLDEHLNPLIDRLTTQKMGSLNYAITRLVRGYFGLSYMGIVGVLGTLCAVGLEYYRRMAAKYEDQKCSENGDVF